VGEIVNTHKPIRIELDSSEELRSALNAQFLKDVRANININSQFDSQGNTLNQGSNEGDLTPVQSNEILCNVTLPAGDNISIGSFKSEITKEIYWFNLNSFGNHTIFVSSSETNVCRKVYEGSCLNFQFPSQYHLPAHRVTLYVVYDQSDDGEKTIKSKYLVWTDGYNWQGFLDVETSIATDSFNSTLYPYWKTFYPHCDPCEFIQLGVRPPQTCPKVLPFTDDTDLQFYEDEPAGNFLKQKVWYFRTDFILTDGRHTVMSPISTMTFLDGGDCNEDAEDIKCFRLVLDAGSALVEKIRVYFSNDGINWFLYDTIDKWDDCMSPPLSPPSAFWERDLALKNYYAPNSDSPPCTPTGCFSTFTYTWDLTESPQLDFTSATIVIDGVTYSNSALAGFHGFVLWLSSLGKGTFAANGDTISTSSASIVYGHIVINNSPALTFNPVKAEIDQCGSVNTFIYQFCGNKGCEPISTTESDRIFDELPIVSVAQTAIDNQIAFGDNLTGYDNFSCPLENINITVVQDDAACETDLVTIIVDAVIQQFNNFSINNPIYQLANTTQIAFGGLGSGARFCAGIIGNYQQQIMNPGKGFIGKLRSTQFTAISQQYRISDLTTTVLPDNVDYNATTRAMMDSIEGGDYFIQRFKFQVPRGRYIFEIASHLAVDVGTSAETSTYFLGTIPKTTYDAAIGNINKDMVDKNYRELLINCCDGDVTVSNYVVIADLSQPTTVGSVSNAKAAAGYLKEKNTNIPIELARLNIDEIITLQSFGTDAYGFYFLSNTGSSIHFHLDILNPNGCAFLDSKFGGFTATQDQLTTINPFFDNGAGGLAWNEFNDCAHELVEGTVKDCDGNPIAGVPVMLTRTGRYAITDLNGHYTILAHDDANWYSQFTKTRQQANRDSLIISQSGVCLFQECSNSPPCNTCIAPQHVNFTNSCFHCSGHSPPTTPIDYYYWTLKILSGALTGLKTGGTYEVSIIGYDYLDRNNFAQRIGFFTVPTIQSNGVFAPYHFNWTITGNLDLPSWVAKIRFAVRGNDYTFLLSWDTNKVEFLDANGNVTAPSIATNIKLFIDGLNTFNTNNFQNTNTQYQWVAGDRIRFITNGDGTVYDEISNNGLIDLPVSSLVNGNALLIPFDSRLIGLTANATFELYRVPECTTAPIFWEQCDSIPVLYNSTTHTYEPTITSGTIPFFDTFWFFRAIPQTDQNGLPTVFLSGHRYEHHSVSDFYGSHLIAIGRPFTRNPDNRQTWLNDEVRYSDVLFENGLTNGLSTFRSANFKNYFTPNCGGIVALRAHSGFLFILYESYFDSVNIAQNLLMITAQGNVQANSDYLGNRQQKVAIIYGCDLRDTSSIIFHNEFLFFADVQRGVWCKSNYQTVWDVTQEQQGVSIGNFRSYITEKFKRIAQLRDQNTYNDGFMYLHAGYDPKTDEVIMTAFSRIASPAEVEYTNQEKEWAIDLNETFSFNVSGGYFSGTYGFTPERYIDFGSGANGSQFVSFKNSVPYLHHVIKSSNITYNNYYGQQSFPVIEFVFNGGEGKNTIQKRHLAIRVLCKQSRFFSDKIWTQAQQYSQIPLEEFQSVENYSEAGFLCDILTVQPNGISALVDGDSLSSEWIKIRLLIDPDNIGKYFELEGIIVSSTESF
jgi:hypothetical protein